MAGGELVFWTYTVRKMQIYLNFSVNRYKKNIHDEDVEMSFGSRE